MLVPRQWRSANLSVALSPMPSPRSSTSIPPLSRGSKKRSDSLGGKEEELMELTIPSSASSKYPPTNLHHKPHTPTTPSHMDHTSKLNTPNTSIHFPSRPSSLSIPHPSSRAHSPILHSLLRPSLLLPDPMIYYICVIIDLLLRFTWSLKLSSHLHHLHDIESGIYLLEALELARRWMWVFLRVEWENVKNGERGPGFKSPHVQGNFGFELSRPSLEGERRDGGSGSSEEEIGMGILVEKKERI
jgi:hypothetical protein